MCKKLLNKESQSDTQNAGQFPIVFSRDQHNVSRKLISDNALKVLYRLQKGGFEAYLVGGGVRDMLLGITPKDFDIATNATPEQIKALFRNCRLIGRRFRLAHIVFGRDIIEVATFRGHHESADEQQKNCKKTSKQSSDGMLLRDNIYGSIEEDAERRDFTINALYYNVANFNVYDFAGGVADINKRQIRLIGDPETRYREDPVRMLRAVRFATKLDMHISSETEAPISKLASLLGNIPPARMFEEFLKLFISGKAVANFTMLRDYGLFKYLFPLVEQHLAEPNNKYSTAFITLAMTNTDARINNEQRVTPAFLLAAMLWYPLEKQVQQLKNTTQLTPQDAFFGALHEVMSEQQRSIAIPKRFQAPMKDIFILQDKLARRDGKRAYKTFEHPKFRAGYDFLLLRGEIEGGEVETLAKWWTDFQAANQELQQMMIKSLPSPRSPRRNIRKRRKPRSKTVQAD
ncbi:polynucleotide adenylyltransferase PcnB [Colwellia sp. MEBiC06753]